jgi:hypothetical protein
MAGSPQSGLQSASIVETLFRVRDALDRNAKASDVLANRIRRLTVWLLACTALITVLTCVLTWGELRKLWGHG